MQSAMAATARPHSIKAIIEADPGALVRVLQFFQTRNVVPRRINASRLGSEFVEAHIEIDSAELGLEGLRAVAAKIEQLPITMAVVICD
jgi:prephenate dehydratase